MMEGVNVEKNELWKVVTADFDKVSLKISDRLEQVAPIDLAPLEKAYRCLGLTNQQINTIEEYFNLRGALTEEIAYTLGYQDGGRLMPAVLSD